MLSNTLTGSTCHADRGGGACGVALARGAGLDEARSSVAMHRELKTAACSVPAATFAAATCASTVLGTACANSVAAVTLHASAVTNVFISSSE
jgi:hypothetical protein